MRNTIVSPKKCWEVDVKCVYLHTVNCFFTFDRVAERYAPENEKEPIASLFTRKRIVQAFYFFFVKSVGRSEKRADLLFSNGRKLVGVLRVFFKESVIVVSRIFACHAFSVRKENISSVIWVTDESIRIDPNCLRFEYFNEP